MIADKVQEINQIELEAAQIISRAREDANEQIRRAHHKASEIVGSIHRKRKEIIQLKVEEAETRARKKVREINEEGQAAAVRTEKAARGNLKDASHVVFERALKYGHQ